MAKFQKHVSVGAFAKKDEDFKDGDLLTIANEGKKVMGQFGEQDVFLVKLPKGDEKNMTFNQTSLNNMIDAFGDDSISWVGKQVKVWLIRQSVSGKMLKVAYLSHPNATITDDGSFVIPGKEAEVKTEINPDDIPF